MKAEAGVSEVGRRVSEVTKPIAIGTRGSYDPVVEGLACEASHRRATPCAAHAPVACFRLINRVALFVFNHTRKLSCVAARLGALVMGPRLPKRKRGPRPADVSQPDMQRKAAAANGSPRGVI